MRAHTIGLALMTVTGISTATPLAAAEVAAPSKVDAVTVFPAGAEVTRVTCRVVR